MAASSCGGDDDDEEEAEATPRRTTTSERETTTTTLDPEEAERQAVVAAYEGAMRAASDSAAPPSPSPELPALAETHTGFMLDYRTAEVEGLQATGLAVRYPDNSQYRIEVDSVSIEDVDGRRVAYMEVCTVTDAEQIVVATGGVVSGGIRTIQASEAMVNENGAWKLAEHRANSNIEGVAGCAVD